MSLGEHFKTIVNRESELAVAGWNMTPAETKALGAVFEAARLWSAFTLEHPQIAHEFAVIQHVSDVLSSNSDRSSINPLESKKP